MSLEPGAGPTTEFLRLIHRWIALREEELLIFRLFEAELGRREAPLALTSSLEFAAPLPAPGLIECAAPIAHDPAVEVDLGEALGEYVLLIDRGDGWAAFPWGSIARVSAREATDEHPYEIRFRALGDERGLSVARTGRIVTRAQAVDLGVALEWRLPTNGEEELERIALRGAIPSPPAAETSEGGGEGEPAAAPLAAPAPAPSPAPAPASAAVEEPLPWEPRLELRPVFVFEIDASEAHPNGGNQHQSAVPVALDPRNGRPSPAAVDPPPPTTEVPTAPGEPPVVEADLALVAVQYLPARVALARALRLAGWRVEEEPDPTELTAHRRVRPPGLLCFEPPERTEAGPDTARDLAAQGTRVFLVASRHRVNELPSPPDLPRLLHPFAEGELEQLPAPPSPLPA